MKLLVIVAHPDDMEYECAGICALYVKAGYDVQILSACSGNGGHHVLSRDEIRDRRYGEIQEAAKMLGVKYDVFSDMDDCSITADLETRRRFIRYIREAKPDLIITHRTNDYHADHRNVGMLVQDASYMLTVPLECPDVPALRTMPVIAFHADKFEKPPFRPDVVIDTDSVIETKFRLLDFHKSQVYEWLPYITCDPRPVPPESEPEERFKWLVAAPEGGKVSDKELDKVEKFGLYYQSAWYAKKYRRELIKKYGKKRGSQIRFCEALEISEYGSPLTEENKKTLFPF